MQSTVNLLVLNPLNLMNCLHSESVLRGLAGNCFGKIVAIGHVHWRGLVSAREYRDLCVTSIHWLLSESAFYKSTVKTVTLSGLSIYWSYTGFDYSAM